MVPACYTAQLQVYDCSGPLDVQDMTATCTTWIRISCSLGYNHLVAPSAYKPLLYYQLPTRDQPTRLRDILLLSGNRDDAGRHMYELL